MKLVICAGPSTTGKTRLIRHLIRRLIPLGEKPAFLKLDVQFADEAEIIGDEFGVPTKTVYSGELCPDHCNVLILSDAKKWAVREQCTILFIETAGLCLRCSPYVEEGLGIVVLEATSGANLPMKVGPMLSLADIAVVTKIDRISQAEKEVFRSRIMDAAPSVRIREVNALQGIGIDPLVDQIQLVGEAPDTMFLRGNPPVGTCTICVGKKEVGWESHYGIVRPLEEQTFYRGE